MNFFIHENFSEVAGLLLKIFDGQSAFELFSDTYPSGTPDAEWIGCVGKQAQKPFVVSGNDGMLTNAVARRALKESGCSFVYLSTALARQPWSEQVWKLMRVWPEVVRLAKESTHQCTIEITGQGKARRFNL